jgi:hypothetical protein
MSPPARALLRFGATAVGALLLLLTPVARAVPQSGDDLPLDLRLTLTARQALADDDDLAPLRLGVTVHQRVAILWGVAPSTELIRRAVQRLQSVPGLAGVRSEVLPELHMEAATRHLDQPGVSTSPAPRGPVWPPAELAGTEMHGRAPAQPAAAVHPEEMSPARPPLHTAVALGPPVAIPDPAAVSPRKPAAVLLRPVPQRAAPPQVVPGSAPDPANAVERLRRSDERFGHLRPEIRERTVTLRGTVRRGEDLMDFAQAVSRLPGVERVILDEVNLGTGR